MKKTILVVGSLVIVLALAGAELFYFRFHTYLQTTSVDEELPEMEADESVAQPDSTAADESQTAEPETSTSTGPTMLAAGEFVGIDFVHKGSGTARIIEQGGVRYLRFENFQVTNGPDLFVYLSNSENPRQSLGAYADLGRLKANTGNQNYEIPQGYYEGYNTAIIWCRQFSILFSYAVTQ
jgi:hypothetical protein